MPSDFRIIIIRLNRFFSGIICALIILILSFLSLPHHTVPAIASHLSDYEVRKAQVLTNTTQSFVGDSMQDVETALDMQPFDEINKLTCPKPINDPKGWSVEMRTGGRPFINFDDIEINGASWPLERCTKGDSNISQEIIDAHYEAGKTVNRMWFIHSASNGFPTVLVMTPDGFFNAAGAQSPELQGAVTRIGFIGEPFGDNDYLQHVDEVNISVVDYHTLLIVYNIHSEAGEGVLELELKWDAINERPELRFRSVHATRHSLPRDVNELGFAGFNFMKGPTVSATEAFHDGRTLFSVHADGSTTPNLLISPTMTDTVVREIIANDTIAGSKIVLDQPQNVANYFSKLPDPSYEERTDLILKLISSSVEPIKLKRAQKSVDLTDVNPEANETVNVFYAIEMVKGQLYEFSYILSVAAEDFEQLYSARRQSVVFISDRSEFWSPRLYRLPLDETLSPVGTPIPLTDFIITDPHHPSASAEGRFIVFDADDYAISSTQRIYVLDLNSGALRRLTLDPFGSSSDEKPSLSGDDSQFSMITNRSGTSTKFNIEDVASGLDGGFGNQITTAFGADWCHIRNEIVYVDNSGLHIYDVNTMSHSVVITMSGIQTPRFSPSCDQVAYVDSLGIWIVNTNGSGKNQVLSNADFPSWIDEDHLIFQRTIESNTDIYLLTITTGATHSLTTDLALDSQPAYVRAVSPTIAINSPTRQSETCRTVQINGFVTSVGIPKITVYSVPATVEGDQWSLTMDLPLGNNTLVAEVIDSATKLKNQAEIDITVVEHCWHAYLPVLFKDVY